MIQFLYYLGITLVRKKQALITRALARGTLGLAHTRQVLSLTKTATLNT